MNVRVPKWVADTGWLLSYGAVPETSRLLREMFDGSLSAPPAVKSELANIASRPEQHRGEKNAAAAYQGTSAQMVLDIAFLSDDVVERDFAHGHLTANTLPAPGVTPIQAASTSGDESDTPVSPSAVHMGESEAMAICLRTALPLLMNDPSATPYARRRSLAPENATISLLRLKRIKTARQLLEMHHVMERVTTSGTIVPGFTFFRQPAPSTASRPADAPTVTATETSVS
jgi:hypothetical protein